jgi:prevent-host-death family protein
MQVGIRELSRNVSKILDRVEAGETITITRHGKPVARLVPHDASKDDAFDRLVREGVIRPARAPKTGDVPPPVPVSPGTVDEFFRQL